MDLLHEHRFAVRSTLLNLALWAMVASADESQVREEFTCRSMYELDSSPLPSGLSIGEQYIPLAERERLGMLNSGHGQKTSFFCGPDAPSNFACRCTMGTTCSIFIDNEGRDLGTCSCCAAWVWVIGFLVIAAIIASIVLVIYIFTCRGAWWCDEYHPAVTPFLPRRGAPVVIPSSLPLPSGVFRGHRPRDFDTGISAEEIAAARAVREQAGRAAEVARQQQEQMREQQRRRRVRLHGRVTSLEDETERGALLSSGAGDAVTADVDHTE